MITCYKSTPSKLLMLLGIISILISVYKSYNFKFIAVQCIIFYSTELDIKSKDYVEKLENLGREYYQLRSRIMVESNLQIE